MTHEWKELEFSAGLEIDLCTTHTEPELEVIYCAFD
jgi:hypothetical protein